MKYEITEDQLAAVNEVIEGWMVDGHDRYSILDEFDYLKLCTVARFDDPGSKVRCYALARDDIDDNSQDMFAPDKYPPGFPLILLLAAAKMKLHELGPGGSYPGNEDEVPDFPPEDL